MENKKELISVIVPVYNCEQYLAKCIESIICQTYSHLEILLIDDGSTDSSGKICDDYAAKDIRIRCIHKQNGGTASARNVGLDNAKGSYVYLIDSDDYIKPDLFEYYLKKMEEHGADIVYAPYIYVNEDYNPINNAWKAESEQLTIYNKIEALSSFLEWKIPCSVCDKLFKKELFFRIRFLEGYLCEDLNVVYRLLAKSQKTVASNMSKYFYLSRTGSQSGGSSSGLNKLINSIILVTDRLIEFYQLEYPQLYYRAVCYALDQQFILYCTLLQKQPQHPLRKTFEDVINARIKILKKVGYRDCYSRVRFKSSLYGVSSNLLYWVVSFVRLINSVRLHIVTVLNSKVEAK